MSRFTGRSTCEQDQFMEQIVVTQRTCTPYTGKPGVYILGECQRQQTRIRECKDAKCENCDDPQLFLNDRCLSESGKPMKIMYSCGEPRRFTPQDFTFRYFHQNTCTGPSSSNIAGGQCVRINQGASWRHYCDRKDGLIKMEIFDNGVCEGKPEDENDYQPNQCVTWMGSYHVIFENCTKSA